MDMPTGMGLNLNYYLLDNYKIPKIINSTKSFLYNFIFVFFIVINTN